MENKQPDSESGVQLEKVTQDEAFFESEKVLQETSGADARSTSVCRKQISDQNFYMKSVSVGDIRENNKRLRSITSMLIRVRMLHGDKSQVIN